MTNKLPELRFPQFKEIWEKKKLGDISLDLSYGMNAAAKDFDGENKYIRITDIDESNNNYIEENMVSPSGKLDDKYLLEEGDLLFARTGASTGKTYYYKKNDGKIYYAGFLIRAKIDDSNNYRYIFYNTLTERYRKWVSIMSVRSGQPGINAQEYSSFPIYIPSLPEQQRIASLLSTIDSRIVNQEDKIKTTEDIKKGYMQRIFSQEIRFKDENGEEYPDWEEKRLGEIGNIVTGETPKADNAEHFGKKYLWATPGDMNSGKYVKKTIRGLSEEGFKSIRNIKKDSVLVTCIGSTIGKLAISSEEMSTNQQVNAIECNGKNNYEFLYYSLVYNSNLILKYATTQAVPLINKSTFAKIKIMTPSLEEQEKIGKFLSLFDEKIEIEKEILKTLKDIKKGLLQQMFV